MSEDKKKLVKKIKRNLINIALKIVFVVCMYFAITHYVLSFISCDSDSMYPMIKRNDLLIVDVLSDSYYQNDVVVFDYNGSQRYGRIVGQSGDVITSDVDGLIRINGFIPSEIVDTVSAIPGGIAYPYTVGQGEYFILCDNAANSTDSRFYGAIRSSQIKGKVIMLLRKNSI